MNRKDRRGNKTTYLSGNTGIRLICEAVAVELLFYAMLAIFRSAFGWQLPIRALGKLQVAINEPTRKAVRLATAIRGA